jgi:hypothetical protein
MLFSSKSDTSKTKPNGKILWDNICNISDKWVFLEYSNAIHNKYMNATIFKFFLKIG